MEDNLERLFWESVKEGVLPLTSHCSLRCIFCSHRQNPEEVESFCLPDLQADQLEQLLPCIDPGRPLVIGESTTRLIEGEPLLHPRVREILEAIRERYPRLRIKLTTAGTDLLEHIRFLAGLAPLELTVSLNIRTPELRRRLLGDDCPEQTLAAVEKLGKTGIPFTGSIVSLIGITGWEELVKTTGFLAENGADFVRILRPGYTRTAPKQVQRAADVPAGRLQEYCADLAARFEVPVLINPPVINDLNPGVAGVIRNSPAARSGFRTGDTICAVNGEQPKTRVHAHHLLSASTGKTGKGEIAVRMDRSGQIHKKSMIREELEAFHKQRGYRAGGLLFDFDLDPDQLLDVSRMMAGGKQALVLTSPPASQLLTIFVDSFFSEEIDRNLEVRGVPNRFFGGNIESAGLLTVRDIRMELESALRDYCHQGRPKPEIIFISSLAFDSRGRDLVGCSVWELAELGPFSLITVGD